MLLEELSRTQKVCCTKDKAFFINSAEFGLISSVVHRVEKSQSGVKVRSNKKRRMYSFVRKSIVFYGISAV